jgi:hypothetical protein
MGVHIRSSVANAHTGQLIQVPPYCCAESGAFTRSRHYSHAVSNQEWTLVGVAMGAILGGGAQILNAWLQSLRERKTTLREERRAIYTNLVAAISDYAIVWGNFRARKQVGIEPDDRPTDALGARVISATSAVRLVAPEDTATAAMQWQATILQMSYTDSPENGFPDAAQDFHRLARRDLGVRGSAPSALA